MPDRVSNLTSTRPLIDERKSASQEMRSWAQAITELSMITGEGSPEGVIEAKIGRQYTDTNGTTGNILYSKRDSDIAGDRTKGWILV